MEESHRDAYEQVVEFLVQHDMALDRKSSRIIVDKVVDGILNQPVEANPVSDGDLYLMDDEAYSVLMLIWELEGTEGAAQRRKLLEIITRLQRVLRVVHKYVAPYRRTDVT